MKPRKDLNSLAFDGGTALETAFNFDFGVCLAIVCARFRSERRNISLNLLKSKGLKTSLLKFIKNQCIFIFSCNGDTIKMYSYVRGVT